jgi:hypothetical protein
MAWRTYCLTVTRKTKARAVSPFRASAVTTALPEATALNGVSCTGSDETFAGSKHSGMGGKR